MLVVRQQHRLRLSRPAAHPADAKGALGAPFGVVGWARHGGGPGAARLTFVPPRGTNVVGDAIRRRGPSPVVWGEQVSDDEYAEPPAED